MKVAFIHDWLGTYRGGERVLAALLELYPEAPLHTLFYDAQEMPKAINDRKIEAHRLFGNKFHWRRFLLPLLPSMIESFNFNDYELLISSSSCIAKGAIPAPGAKHICYIHSPMRYAWDQRFFYMSEWRKNRLLEFALESMLSKSRIWDSASSSRVDRFVANSSFVSQRIKKYYGRDSTVVHPFVGDIYLAAEPTPNTSRRDYYLCAGALVPYKRVELAIAACEQLNRKLIIAGGGPEFSKLAKQAGKNTTMIHSPDPAMWTKLMREARGLLFPGVEDFGITPLEAIALGTPVIAYKAGGALDYIQPEKNGVFFGEQSAEAISVAIEKFEGLSLDPSSVSATARKYSKKRFLDEMRAVINDTLS